MTVDRDYPKHADGRPSALEPRNADEDGRRYSPSAERNREVIAEVFGREMPVDGTILEIASGTGQHGAHMLQRFPDMSWIFSDLDTGAHGSISAWIQAVDPKRGTGPIALDVSSPDWPDQILPPIMGIFCANMVHIAPFDAARGLIVGAGRLLAPGGRLFLYGPFACDGEMTDSNRAFDLSLKSRDPRWGVRDLDLEILPLARAEGFGLVASVDMPANNLSVVLQKR